MAFLREWTGTAHIISRCPNRDPSRSHHDMGGLAGGAGAAGRARLRAVGEAGGCADDAALRRTGGCVTVDELRRNIESLGGDAYDKMTYYERWIYAITQTLLQRGVITVDELGRKMEAIQAQRGRTVADACLLPASAPAIP